MPFHKPCPRCGERFKPFTRATTLCDKCWENSHYLKKNENNMANRSKEIL